jgi:hypothetical protein
MLSIYPLSQKILWEALWLNMPDFSNQSYSYCLIMELFFFWKPPKNHGAVVFYNANHNVSGPYWTLKGAFNQIRASQIRGDHPLDPYDALEEYQLKPFPGIFFNFPRILDWNAEDITLKLVAAPWVYHVTLARYHCAVMLLSQKQTLLPSRKKK